MTGVEVMLLIGVLVCLFAEGFFSGSETAIVSADRAQLRAAALAGDPRATLAERLLARVETVLGTTLVGTNFAVATSTSLATLLVARHVPEQWATLATTLVLTPLILIVGEIVPKSICRANAYRLTLLIARPLRWAQLGLYPFVWLASKTADRLLRVVGAGKTDTEHSLSREELVVLAEISQEHGALAPQERRMIERLLALNERPVSTAMAPLVDVAAVDAKAPCDAVKELAARTGFARFPVYEGRVDNIVGIVALVDVLFAEARGEDTAAQGLAPFIRRDVMFVPETKPIGPLLRELQTSRTPMVVVVDEHGGVVGMVSREDIVEEVVGDIHDERDRVLKVVAAQGGRALECEGRVEIDDLAAALKITIDKEGFETVSGFVMKLAGRIPQAGETFDFEGMRIEVLDADQRRVKRVRVVRATDGE